MMQRLTGAWCLCLISLFAMTSPVRAETPFWSMFRGSNATGVAAAQVKLPTDIGPTSHVLWKVSLAPGHSSPVIAGNRLFVTAIRDKKLYTIGIDRTTGTTLWEQEAPYEKLEEIHRIGSHCQSSPATDGERVVSFFGSSGLYCYDLEGKLLWKKPMGPFNNNFGAGSSPLIVDDVVILGQDHDTDSFLMALDKKTGEVRWKTDRSEFPRNYCTPVVWNVDGKKQLVIAATLRVVGYDFATGKELWTVRGISRTVCTTPVIGPDNTLYVAGWAAGGDEGEPIRLQPWDKAVLQDKNNNQILEEAEVTDNTVKMRFPQIDRDKTGGITQAEYEFFATLFAVGKNLVIAIKPGGKGDCTETHRLWQVAKFVPFCSSPIVYNGLVYWVKDGGIVSCVDAKTGKPTKQGRLPATDEYYASPVAGDGKVYFLNEEGKLTVLSAEKNWEVLHSADFAEPTYSTPAIVDGKIYLRTNGHLYCFGISSKN